MEATRAKIRAFLAKFFQHADLKDSDDIFALGFVNSLFAMQLVLFIESEFRVTIEDDDLDINNFRSIDAMAQLIERKTTSHLAM
ncbi:acyl carrier protein [Thermosporothrix hazakensis]|jgi:acyl carrier protein|uniref:Acyl carrier protein n=2 Tax=Thermosporothrix TaxID=768650 RepID=A0A326U4Z5_THEHA|nr:phosphopantetheine-binding protein [Thermosporothrix hazakensis]PZW27156.1 acyl carrier protein [Thermosporothrix hazakensis]BBH88022.1 hypothetical protein KTC_27730 [Thermosporothrix sp. COM3]GCE50440.1 hypothetical protein KTH_53090 [Thermosporothrix hazakensis]